MCLPRCDTLQDEHVGMHYTALTNHLCSLRLTEEHLLLNYLRRTLKVSAPCKAVYRVQVSEAPSSMDTTARKARPHLPTASTLHSAPFHSCHTEPPYALSPASRYTHPRDCCEARELVGRACPLHQDLGHAAVVHRGGVPDLLQELVQGRVRLLPDLVVGVAQHVEQAWDGKSENDSATALTKGHPP
jgi:hypothetical protein